MVRSVNQVGHLMGIQVIAEYVENEEIIGILRDIGVDYGQGYGISKPLPLAEVIQRHAL
jgi:EAL domain-containing protein (putative c-di-GMP-specific phosphodiesterase class I)